MKSSLRVRTVFDERMDHPGGALHANTVQSSLRRIFPDPLFFEGIDEERREDALASFESHLPVFKWRRGEGGISLFFLARRRPNIGKFFYDMISRWLIPGKRVDAAFFFTADFQLTDFSDSHYTLAEMAVRLEFDEQIAHNLQIIEAEVRLGMVSVYHASRLLEAQAISGSEKGSAVQEKVAALIQKKPDEIDYDIFGEMQHFLVMGKEEFKAPRSAHHLSRIIALFYLFRKSVQRDSEAHPEKRHIRCKIAPATLDLPWGMKRVVGVAACLNMLKSNELFEERHLLKALQNAVPGVKKVDDSYFVHEEIEDGVRTFYIEIEKEGGWTPADLRQLRLFLPEEIKRSIEVSARAIFMPRNEEEVMRSVVALAGQLRFVRDLPQVILSFVEQTEGLLSFHVVLVRVLLPHLPSIQELFHSGKSFMAYVPDRVKRLGMLRKRYPKEATVFEVRFPSDPYIRDDHSVDLYRARQDVVAELQRIVGEVRDYNGGMIAKQVELLKELKNSVGVLTRQEELLLENFFHSIFPIEMRSISQPGPLLALFTLWKELMAHPGQRLVVKEEKEALFAMGRGDLSPIVEKLETAETELLIAKPKTDEESFTGLIFFCQDEGRRRALLDELGLKESLL